MDKSHILVDMNEASSTMLRFIGSDEYNNVVSSIENNAKAGFLTGLSYAITLIMSECRNYYAVEQPIDNLTNQVSSTND